MTYNAVGQITTDGYSYDKVGNLTKAPGQTFTYNGAQQLTSSTKDGVTTTYEYAGADMNKLLSQSTDGGAEYDYTYGATDQNGVPVISSRTVAGTGTASVISDPVTGQPMDLQTTDGTTSMWVVDGIGNPTAAITDAGAKAYEVHYDPYGAERIHRPGQDQHPVAAEPIRIQGRPPLKQHRQRAHQVRIPVEVQRHRRVDRTRHPRRTTQPDQRQPIRLRRKRSNQSRGSNWTRLGR
ncbi:hypothetical protein QPJ90_01550 [Curtobacterium sp. 458]|nr:hypothetical protein [Curtobacterium sp. 458]WJY00391.1 hypothetical protein QPJ90_01550 [Curtobacterium sp. 458]